MQPHPLTATATLLMHLKSKLLFGAIIGAVASTIIASILVYQRKGRQMSPFRMAFEYSKPIAELDPSNVSTLSEAVLLRNLYSSLFEYDDSGGIVTGLAGTYVWVGQSLKIEFSEKAVTSDGLPITAEDAALSLKRLMVLNKNRHGDLKDILCPGIKLNELSDSCPGLSVVGKSLVLTPASSTLSQQLIPLLATVDYRILPARVIGNSPLYPITRFDITSGPYSLSGPNSPDCLRLRANPFHYSYTESMPQQVELLNISRTEAVERFIEGTIDAIPTSTPVLESDLTSIEESVPDLSVAKTLNLKIKMIYFGKSALRDFSPEERFSFSAKLKTELDKVVIPFESPTIEFFQDLASGYLTAEQRVQIEELRKPKVTAQKPKRKLVIGTTPSGLKRWEPFSIDNPQFETKVFNEWPTSLPPDKRPDAYFGVNDVAFNRSASVIAYNLSNGAFGVYGEDAKRWMTNYTQMEPAEAVAALNQIHYNALANCIIYPLASAPYTLFTRNSWIAKLNPFFSATELWMIRRN